MLDVVTGIREDRIRNGRAMAILTGYGQVHTVGCVMVYVMGEQVQGSTVIYIAVTLGTVAGDPAVLQGTVSVMAGGTGIMLDAVAGIYKRLTGGYGRCMAGGAVSNEGHVTVCGMIDGVIIPGTARMTGGTYRTAAGTRCRVSNERNIRGARMTGGTGIMLLVVAAIRKGRIGYRYRMAIQTRSLGVHTVGGVMVDVMGEQVQDRTVIYSAVAGGTVSRAAYAAGCCCYQAVVVTSRINVTGDTGVMDSVV